eukprot:s6455_g2.t1
MVANILALEMPRQLFAAQLNLGRSATFGVDYGKHQFTGICRQTLTHANTTRLLNALVLRDCPWHKWSTVALLYNFQTPVHIDQQNGPEPSLILVLSHEGGEVWIEDSDGREYVEHQQGWLRGGRHSVHLQAVRFLTNRRRHFTCGWTWMDRVILTAYTVSRWESVADSQKERLEALGFILPERRRGAKGAGNGMPAGDPSRGV